MKRVINTNMKWFMVCIVLAVMSNGCSTEDRLKDTSNQIQEADTRTEYANDLERLQILTDKINRTLYGNYVVVFGDVVNQQPNMVGVDYGLFDRLGDGGVVVMIAEAVLTKQFESEKKTVSTDPAQTDVGPDEKTIRQIDFQAGQIVAKAGFDSGGFSKWLLADSTQNTPGSLKVASNIREASFMKGYLSVAGRGK